MGLESLLQKGRKQLRRALIAGLASSALFLSCGKDSPTEPPEPKNNSPVITSSPLTQINENDFYEYKIQATDPNGDPLNYSLTEGPGWLSVSHNIVYGNSPEVSQNQTFPVKVKVSDGKDFVIQDYNLTVRNLFNIYMLSQNEANNISSIQDNSITFSNPINYSIGDIIASGIYNKTPEGLLREIISIPSNRRTINTRQATLEQVLRKGSFSYSGALKPSQISSSSYLEGVSMSLMSGQDFDFNIKLTNVVLYDKDGNPNTTGDQLIANGNVLFNTDMIFNLNINDYRINDLIFRNLTAIDADVTVGTNILGIASLNEIKIVEFNFQPFVAGYLPTPVPIPLVMVPALGVYVGIDPTNVNPLSVRVQQDANFDAGLFYNNGSWGAISNFSNTFTFSNPAVSGELELKLYAGPRLELLLYGITGPFAGINGRLRLAAGNESWKLYGGLGVSLGVKMEVLKRGVSAQFRDVIEYEKLLAEGETQQPIGKIVFVRIIGDNADIYSMKPDGSNSRNLTNTSSLWETYPSCSPDGAKILFSSKIPFSSDDFDIYVMNADGSGKTQLIASSMDETHPVVSPDASMIAYSAGYLAGHEQIYIMNAEGSNLRNITNDNTHFYWDLAWFPGSALAFYSNRNNQPGEIYTINSNGSNLRRLTNNSDYDRFPSWSSDGRISFSSTRTGNSQVWIMNADGSNPINISNNLNIERMPSWSPDGKNIVYVSGTDNSSEIWTMNADGSNKIRITNNSYHDVHPIWCN